MPYCPDCERDLAAEARFAQAVRKQSEKEALDELERVVKEAWAENWITTEMRDTVIELIGQKRLALDKEES